MIRVIRRLAASVLLAAAAACASAALATSLPSALPSPAVLADWERIDGSYETPTEQVRYALFVDPERPALYRITQYRVSGRGGAPSAETVIWNETPGRHGPLRCFAEERSRTWRTLWLVPRSSWRDVPPATPEFRGSMLRAIEIYGRANQHGHSSPPASPDPPRS